MLSADFFNGLLARIISELEPPQRLNGAAVA
ncbi:MAG: hypothetical protein ACI80K_000423, partial [Paracoccaceae bacterium]